MKKLISILAIALVMFTACTKKPLNGVSGSNGKNGINGVSSTQGYLFKNLSIGWYNSQTGKVVSTDTLFIPQLTQGVMDSGSVIVYAQIAYDYVAYQANRNPYADTLIWHEMPAALMYNANPTNTYTFVPTYYEKGMVFVHSDQSGIPQNTVFNFKVEITK
jgi:hypothetical protein